MREKEMAVCPRCGSSRVIKNGKLHNSKVRFACTGGQQQVVANSQHQSIAEETKQLADKLLLERVSLAGIVRVSGVSAYWLQ
jgi:insertion element IS1 protein InsB